MACFYKIHDKDERVWGNFEVIDVGANFVVKRIQVSPGSRLSLQTHQYRHEHWIIVQGVAEVTVGQLKFQRKANESVFVPIGEFHRIENIGELPLIFIEIQFGNVLDEEDICRYNEDYTLAL